jgi:hypothetical protein
MDKLFNDFSDDVSDSRLLDKFTVFSVPSRGI